MFSNTHWQIDWQGKQKLRAKFSTYKVWEQKKRQQMSGLPFGLLIILFRFVWSDFRSFINHRNNFRKPQTSHIRLNISNGAVHEPWKYPDKHMLKTFLQSPPQHNEPRWPDHPCSCALRTHAPIYQGSSILNTACRPLLKNEVTPEPRWADRLQNKIVWVQMWEELRLTTIMETGNES